MRDLSPLGIKINSGIGKAIIDHKMIEHGDRILVAVSGGKDSMTLLSFLADILNWAPVKYELFAAHIKTDLNSTSPAQEEMMTRFFEKCGVKYVFKEIKVLDEKKQASCFWCSWNKRKALFETADELGCGKIAFGHHKDDIVETILMNLILKGEISAMNPCQSMFGGKITIIRPLCLVEEKRIKDFAREAGFPATGCNCAHGDTSKRKYFKDLIQQISRDNPKINIKTNIYHSVARVKPDYTLLKEDLRDDTAV